MRYTVVNRPQLFDYARLLEISRTGKAALMRCGPAERAWLQEAVEAGFTQELLRIGHNDFLVRTVRTARGVIVWVDEECGYRWTVQGVPRPTVPEVLEQPLEGLAALRTALKEAAHGDG